MDYTVSDTKLQELNVMTDQGGHIPSAVSNALADAQIAQAGGNQSALTSALNAAIAANKLSGKAWSRVQGWHDGVKDTIVAPPELPPVEIPGMPPVGTIVKKPARFKVPVQETPNHIQVEGPSRPSIAVADGKQVWLGYSVNPDEFIEGQASQSNGTAMIQVPAGVFWMSWKLSPGMGGSTPGDISVY